MVTCTAFCLQWHVRVQPTKSLAAGFKPRSTEGCIATMFEPFSMRESWESCSARVARTTNPKNEAGRGTDLTTSGAACGFPSLAGACEEAAPGRIIVPSICSLAVALRSHLASNRGDPDEACSF